MKTMICIFFSLVICCTMYAQPVATHQLGVIPLTAKIQKTAQKTASGTGALYVTPTFEITSPALVTATVGGDGIILPIQIYELIPGQTPPYNIYSNGSSTITKVLYAGKYLIHGTGGNSHMVVINISLTPINSDKEIIFTQSENYVSTSVPLVEKSTVNYNSKEEMVSLQYFDGLGRLDQTVQKNITPTSMDLISLQQYDSFGRETNSWLPASIENNNGMYATSSSVQTAARSTHLNDGRPVNEINYESSPLNRIESQCGPGAEWWGLSKLQRTGYFTNSSEYICSQFTTTDDEKIVKIEKNGNYPVNTLYVTKQTDEDDNISYEFKNKQGQVLLTRQMNGTIAYDTYYIYDNYGNLRAVLPPEAIDKLIGNGPWTEMDVNLQQLAYLYIYDGRDRCIAKKMPGCDWTYNVYDKADRLIFTQDGEQRAKTSSPEWTFNKYDSLGRLIISGIYRTASTHEAMRTTYSSMLFTETPGSGNFGYSWTTLASIPVDDVLLINYYDDYEAMLKTNSYYKTNLDYNTESGYGIRHSSAKGLLVGTRVKLMGSDGKSNNTLEGQIATAMYYDTRGRLIQTKSTNHLGGLEKEYIAYNFTGQPTKKMHIHTKDANGGGKQTEVYTYTYDHAGRLLTTTHQLTDGTTVRPQVTLVDNTYDELGRLKSNQKGGLASTKTTYGYNIRSWTKSITSPLFTQTLYYNDTYGGSTKQYNGNVGAMNWQVNDGGSLLGYTFSYDNLSRLTSAVYLVNGAVSTAHTDYKTSYSYDKHGNMKTLTRGGVITANTNGLIDNLTMTYTGNQLTKVDDAVGPISLAESMDFKNYSNVATEYTYNANGAMTKDLNKGITEIQYNSLNLPRQMDIKSPVAEARNEYTYSAGGQKLKVVQKWNPNYSTTPVIGSAINTTALTNTKTTDYVGNKIYENGTLKRILIDGGYIEGNVYHYYLTDHLGNNRVVVNASGTLAQKNHYYPFGSIFAGTTGPDKQSYKYNGKELDLMHGLNLYDYSARYYESSIGRFTSVDPLAEMYYNISPYAYVANSPIKHIDEEGKWINNVIGGIFGAAVEYGSQVAVNVAKNGFNSDAFTKNIDLVDIGVAAIEGAITSGASVAKNVVKKAAITATAEVIKNTIDGGTDGSGKVSGKINDVKSVIKNTAIGLTTDVITKGIVPKGKINGNVTTTSKTKVANALKNAGVDGKKASAMSKKITPIVNKAGNNVRREANELSQKSVSSGVSTTIKSNLDDEKN